MRNLISDFEASSELRGEEYGWEQDGDEQAWNLSLVKCHDHFPAIRV